ncbi:MAG: hypothetical protein HPY83_10060 [Anaerolineae bacterium]|nr:hypothetical protein [Anaerolineae bacterium]
MGYGRVLLSTTSLAIRFERIGEWHKFDFILDRFRQGFPEAIWDPTRRAWLLPHSCLPRVQGFCEDLFGPHGFQLQLDSSTAPPFHQLVLN